MQNSAVKNFLAVKSFFKKLHNYASVLKIELSKGKDFVMPDYNVFPDYKTRKEIINELCDRYKFIKHCFAGKSVCGRGIDVLHIGNTKNRVLYCGGFHGSSTSQYLPC